MHWESIRWERRWPVTVTNKGTFLVYRALLVPKRQYIYWHSDVLYCLNMSRKVVRSGLFKWSFTELIAAFEGRKGCAIRDYDNSITFCPLEVENKKAKDFYHREDPNRGKAKSKVLWACALSTRALVHICLTASYCLQSSLSDSPISHVKRKGVPYHNPSHSAEIENDF